MLTWIKNKAIELSHSREPDFAVGPPENPYMLRWWWLPRNRFFNIYVHRFLKDDDDRALHDHPWASLSLLCEGYIREMYMKDGQGEILYRDVSAGQWVYRSPRFAHRIIVLQDVNLPLTIFITGPRIREWGFHCVEAGWRHWKDFVGEGAEGTVGRGCGEVDDYTKLGFHCRGCGESKFMRFNDKGYCIMCWIRFELKLSRFWKETP